MLKCSALAKLKKKLKTDANQKWFWNGFEIGHSNWGGICKYGSKAGTKQFYLAC